MINNEATYNQPPLGVSPSWFVIPHRIKELADEMNKFYNGEEVIAICVLKGAVMFAEAKLEGYMEDMKTKTRSELRSNEFCHEMFHSGKGLR